MERRRTVCIATNENCPLLISLKVWEEAPRTLPADRRPRDSGARLRGSGGRIGATTFGKRRGMVEVRARQLRILIMGAAPSLPPL